jgi:isopropylmalate/homocitrate/citramalate synthase
MSDRQDEPMRRTPGVSYEPDDRADVLDFVADYGFDAIDAGVPKASVVAALREAADEIEASDHEAPRSDPDRSEAADMGGGASTGVQEL